MFGKRCKRCGERISRSFQFCPFCGTPAKRDDSKDYGLLGKDDEVNDFDSMFRGVGNPVIDRMLGSAMKMLEKEIKQIGSKQERLGKVMPTDFQLYINGQRISLPQFGAQFSEKPVRRAVKKSVRLPVPSEDTIRAAANLPRKEAQAKLKRLANKIIYEINAPGVSSMDKILISKTEDGIEARIFTKEVVLTKNIQISLPLIAYYLQKQKLFLEFRGR